jgi:hypothetical protein
MMTLTDRLRHIEQAAREGAEHIASTVALHLPVIEADPLFIAIEDATLTPPERGILAGVLTATVKAMRSVAGEPADASAPAGQSTPQPPPIPDPAPASASATAAVAPAPPGTPAAG